MSKNLIPSFLLIFGGIFFALYCPIGCSDGNDEGESHSGDDEGGNTLVIPPFVSMDYIDLAMISKISRFRSGEGHDYSDDFESCRSMKHYYVPINDLDWAGVNIFSPVDGIVVQIDQGWAGNQVRIESEEYQDLFFILFHVNTIDLDVGDSVAAGELIGTHIGPETWSDIAVGYSSSQGWRLLSFFNLMNDTLFESYRESGLISREAAIITAGERNDDPLTCEGEQFEEAGTIDNWIVLDK